MIVIESEVRVALGLVPTITDAQRARLMLAINAAHAGVRKHIGYDPEQRVGPAEMYPRNEISSSAYSEGVFEVDAARQKAIWLNQNRTFKCLQLARLPVRAIISLRVDQNARYGQGAGDFPAESELVSGQDYYLEWDQENVCNTGQVLSETAWPALVGSVKVVYRAGYSSLEFMGPADGSAVDENEIITSEGVDASPIKAACLLTCIAKYHTLAAWGVNSLTGALVSGPLQSERMGDYSYSLANGAQASMIAGMAASLPPEAAEMLEPYVNYGQLVL